MNKAQMIELLVDDDLNDWNTVEQFKDYMRLQLISGFKGYKHFTLEELMAEIEDRELEIENE